MNRIDQYDWNRLYTTISRAEKRLEEAVWRALPVGSECNVVHGDHLRPVTVVKHLHDTDLLVEGVTGSQYRVSAFRIEGIGDTVSFS